MAVLLLALGGFGGEKAWAVGATTASIASTPDAASTYKVGEDIEVDVTFDGVVYVQEDEDAGELELILSIGQHSRRATYVDGSGNSDMKLHFRYTVQSGDEDEDGISIAQGTDSLVGGVLVDASSTDVTRGFTAVGVQTSHKVDGIIPTVTTVAITSMPKTGSNNTYSLAEPIEVDITFDEVVSVDETVGELVLVLSIGQHSRRATFVGGSGSSDKKLHFRYIVQRGDEDLDGVSIGAGPAALLGATVTDFAGNPVDRAFDAVGEDIQHKVDGVTPSLNAARITSTPESGDIYGLNEEIRVAVDFGEPVHATDPEDNLELILSIGQHSRSAKLADGSGTETLTFAYLVQSDDEDDDGISIGPTALRGGVLQDAAGNPVDRNFGGRHFDTHQVDGVRPSLKAMRIVSNPDNGNYGLNEEIEVHVDFDEEVHVDETESELVLVLAIGQHSREATFVEGSGTHTLIFKYVVQSGDSDIDGISIGPGISDSDGSLRRARIRDRAGNPVDRAFIGLAADGGHMVDGVRPSMKRVNISSTPVANQTYGLNEEIRVEVDFGEMVFVDETDGELMLVLSIGQHSRLASYVDGGGSDTLVFGYVVQSDDSDDDGISIGPNALRGGVIQDAAGNTVDRTSAGMARDDRHRVDGMTISQPSVEIDSTPAGNGTYGLNEEIRVHVNFGEVVHVTGTVTLVLDIGDHEREAAYAGGSGTDTLAFRYVVRANDKDDDGVSIGADALQGEGTIEDGDGIEVTRGITRLAPDSGHKVDGINPSLSGVRIVSRPDSGNFYGLNEEIRVAVDFRKVVHVTNPEQDPTLLLSIGENLRVATLASGSGTDTLTFRYVVQADDYDDDGISIGANALQGGIEDASGNPIVRTFAGLAANRRHRVDGVIPVMNRVRIQSPAGHDGTYTVNEEITIKVDFGEEVHVKGEVTVDVTIGEHTRQATFVSGSGTDILTFRYVVQSDDYDDEGISIPPNCLNGIVVDVAGNPVDDTYRGRGADSRHKVDGLNSARPTVQIVPPRGHDGIYGLNEEIRATVDFPEEVHVTGNPTLILSIGEHSRAATLANGSGTKRLTFSYLV